MARTHVIPLVRFKLFVCFLAAVIFVTMFSGCETLPVRTLTPLPEQTSSQIVQTLQEREAQVVSLKGLFHAEIDGKGMPFAQSLQGSIFYQRPDHYRIKGFTRFGGLLFDFVLAGEAYALRVEEHPQPILGGMDNFQRLGELRLPVILSLRAIKVLLGKLPVQSHGLEAVQSDLGWYRFDIPVDSKSFASRLIQRLLIEEGSLQIRQLEFIRPDGESEVTIHTSDFRPVGGKSSGEGHPILLPFVVAAEDHKGAGKISLEFQEMKANEAIDERLFAVPSF